MNQKMSPDELLRSIYLGDRACKAVLIESWEKRVAIQIDCISYLRPGATSWDFYTDKDIINGWLVFSNVSRVQLEPSGPLPNDLINEIVVKPILCSPEGKTCYSFTLHIDSVDEIGDRIETTIRIMAETMHIDSMNVTDGTEA